jgi:uncharacterized protein (TIGR03435 family)
VAQGNGHLGPQLKPADNHCSDPLIKAPASPEAQAATPRCSIVATRTQLWGDAATMPNLASTLQSMVGRPVVDKTGLRGRFDIRLKWASMQLSADGPTDADSPDSESLFTALREQVGLKLIPQKETFDVLVVDHIARPTPD